ncbi:MAG: NAD(+) synthase [Candidatus Heimdallarchaeota archaeon]|nr:NAD(+) synthase [Candidatus Heimdallarchaeota archaeon]MCK4769282.1 NAD(+) synthase [Candidatus Heimdallarchaeota archaeon]
MSSILHELELDIPSVCTKIENLIRNTMEELGRDGAAVGISGGLDSAVTATLTVRSLGSENVQLFNLPEKDSKPIHKKHAKALAKHLGVKLKTKSITPLVKAAKGYRLLPIGFIPSRRLRSFIVKKSKSKILSEEEEENLLAERLQPKAKSWIAKGNAYAVTKHRMRMVVLYQYAEVNNLMVVGAANKTEWLTGTFSKWGVDHCADVMPLIHIYRSQLEQIAEYLEVPQFIREKYADPDVMPGIDNKGAMLGSFSLVDQILVATENGITLSELYNVFGKKNVEKVLTLKKLSKQMRESPYQIE